MLGCKVDPNHFSRCVWAIIARQSGTKVYHIFFSSVCAVGCTKAPKPWHGYRWEAGLYPKNNLNMLKNLGNKAHKPSLKFRLDWVFRL